MTRSRLTTLVAIVLFAAAPATAQEALPLTSQSDTVDLLGLEQSFRNVARTVTPGVVAITAAADPAPATVGDLRSSQLTAAVLDDLLHSAPRIVGTGFCVDADGFVVTNEHVVRDARQLYVTTDDGRTFPALVVGTDPRSDLAVLKVPTTLPPLAFAAPGTTYRGQWTVAVGNPIGLAGGGNLCMSVGVVSALGRELPRLSEREGRLYTNLIQTTAEVNPGNSGGPLFDLHGKVIGVVTAVVLPQEQTNGIGFAMPADEAMRAKIEQLKRGRPVTHGFLGVSVAEVRDGGVRVTGVGDAAPANNLLRVGDVLLRLDGQAIDSPAALVRLVSDASTTRDLPIALRRDGAELAVSVRLRPREDLTAGVDVTGQRLRWRGATLAVAANGGVRVCALEADSPLAAAGLGVGSVIADVAGRPVRDLVALQRVIDETPVELCKLGLLSPAEDARTAALSSASGQ